MTREDIAQFACPSCDRANRIRLEGSGAKCPDCGWSGSVRAAALAAEDYNEMLLVKAPIPKDKAC